MTSSGGPRGVSFRPASERRATSDTGGLSVVPPTGDVPAAWQPQGAEQPHEAVRSPLGPQAGVPYKEIRVNGPAGLPPLRLGVFSTRPTFDGPSRDATMTGAGEGWVYIPDEKFHIDPHEREVGDTFGPQEDGHHGHKVFISHSHSDHATDQSTATVVASPETHQMLDEFWSPDGPKPREKGSSRAVVPGISYEGKNGWFEFHHNGHMLGSLGLVYRPRIWANSDGTPGKGIWYTGDFNMRSDPFRDGARGRIPRDIHMVITEGTHFSPDETASDSEYDQARRDQLEHWRTHSRAGHIRRNGVPLIFGVHQNGKAQEEMKFWIENGIRPLVHPAIAHWARLHERSLGEKSPFQSPELDDSGASIPGTGNYDVLDNSFIRPKSIASWTTENFGRNYWNLLPEERKDIEKRYSWEMEKKYAAKIEQPGNPRVVLMPQYIFDSRKQTAFWWMSGLGGPLLDRYNSATIQSPAAYKSIGDIEPQSRTRHIVSGRRPLSWWAGEYVPGVRRRPDYSPIGRFPISGHSSRQDMQFFIDSLKKSGVQYGLALHAHSDHPHYLSEYMTRQGIPTNLVGFGDPPDGSGQRRLGYGLFW